MTTINRAEQDNQLRLPELIGTPPVGIIFCDLDGVFVEDNAQFTKTPGLRRSTVEAVKQAGYWLVFNSNTGADLLTEKAGEYGFDKKLVIGENGAVISLPEAKIKEYLSPSKPFFDKFRPDVTEIIRQTYPNADIFTGDATSFVQKNTRIQSSADYIYLINSTRECSIGIYVRSIDMNGNLRTDQDATEDLRLLLTNQLAQTPEKDKLVCKAYPEVGSCLVRDPNINKVNAVRWVMNQYLEGLEYYMIGDTTNDDMTSLGKNRIMTCAVGNGDYWLKVAIQRTGGIVAPMNRRFADGAEYILGQILKGGADYEQTTASPLR